MKPKRNQKTPHLTSPPGTGARDWKSRHRKSATRNRRGVLLLVVLGMLTLFLMIGTAFVISSNQYRRANKSYSKFSEKENLRISQEGFLGEVINQLIRDTTNQNSALRFHSLLRDLYGTEGFRGEVYAPTSSTTAVEPRFVDVVTKYAGGRKSALPAEVYGPTARQFMQFVVKEHTELVEPEDPQDLFGNPIALSTMPDYYAGLVLTWTSGPLEGKSTRIVASRFEPLMETERWQGCHIFTVVTVPDQSGNILEPQFDVPGSGGRSPEIAPMANASPGINTGATFVINGRPFNGTGVGYNSLAAPGFAKLSMEENVLGVPPDKTTPIALMPNATFFEPSDDPTIWSAKSPIYYGLPANSTVVPLHLRQYEGLGGSDESYDAPDFQNMYLAWTGPDLAETIFTDFNATPNPTDPSNPFTRTNPPPYLGNIVLPSFHRPDLIHYWAHRAKEDPGDPLNNTTLGLAPSVHLLRKIMLRPNWIDHPNFNGGSDNAEFRAALANYGSNGDGRFPIDPLLRMIYGPWDVDNDNDGVRDSVWIDFGAPVMIGANGRLVKPLAAVMVLDMDGRLNVNAHASRDMQNPTGFNLTFAGNVSSNRVPKGQAFGVAEISLRPVVGNRYGELLNGEGRDFDGDSVDDIFYPGRYGPDNEPGSANDFDLSAQLKMQGLPAYRYGSASLERSNFGSLPDLRSRYSMGLNEFGQSILEWNYLDFVDRDGSGTFTLGDDARLDEDSPYELDLSSTGPRGKGTAVDNPFSPAELERVLRAYDVDAGSLAPRLYELLKGSQTTQNIDDLKSWRTLLTTDSFDLPEPSFQMPAWVRLGIDGLLDPDTEQFPDDYVRVMGREPVNGTFADLVEYRFRLAQPLPDGIWYFNQDTPARLEALRVQLHRVIAPEVMAGLKLDLNRPFGNGRDDNNNGVVDEPGEFIDSNGNGLAEHSEIAACWRFDYPRTGIDPATLTPTSPSVQFENNFGFFRVEHDRNANGVIDHVERGYTEAVGGQTPQQRSDANAAYTHAELINLDNYRRQLMARYLYVMAMTLVDPLPPLDLTVFNGLPLTAEDKEKLRKEKIKLHSETLEEYTRKMAQWAANVVDFRDPDNIMTAFEYDANPFNGWQVDEDIRTSTDLPNWSDDGIDNNGNGDIDRDDPEELPFRNGIDDDGDGLTDDSDPDEIAERAVVWGMERPELVMTETLGWHDRATWDDPSDDAITDDNGDLRSEITSEDQGQVGLPGANQTGTGQGNFDKDYDQQARPQGAAFIELYNPWAPSAGASADTHLIDPANGNDLGVDLAAITLPSTIPNGSNRTSPVWRIDVRKTVDYRTENGVPKELGRYVGGPDHDPDDPDQRVQPQIPDRCIYFTNFDPEGHFEIRSIPEFPRWETTWDDDGVAFYSSLTDPSSPVNSGDPSYIRNHAVVRPGRYMVVGSGTPYGADDLVRNPEDPNQLLQIAKYEARIGDKKRTREVKRHAIILNPNATGAQPSVMVRNSTPDPGPDTALRDQAGFSVSANADTTSVAIIDSVWFRNVDRVGPSVRYEGREFRRFSVSEPATGYPLAVFGSDWRNRSTRKSTWYNDPEGEYGPNSLDIPLDNQRWNETNFGATRKIDGQTLVGQSDRQIRWTRKSSPRDPTAQLQLIKDNELRLTLPEREETSVRTIPAFSWLYLQRLANPLIPWNPPPGHKKHRPREVVNPYMTVDSMGMNVTVFNGQDFVEKRVQGGEIKEYGNADAIRSFASLQRGRMNVDSIELLRARIRDFQGPVGEPDGNGISSPVVDTGFRNMPKSTAFHDDRSGPPAAGKFYPVREPQLNGATGGLPIAFVPGNLWGEEQVGYVDKSREDMDSDLKYGLGLWRNRAGTSGDGLYRAAAAQDSHFFHSLPDCTLGFLNEPFRNDAAVGDDKKFIPTQPFPWITWNNRPFANAAEMLAVPAFRTSQFLKVFGMSKGGIIPPEGDIKGFYVEKYRGYIRRGSYPVPLDFRDTFLVDPGRRAFNVAFPPLASDGPFGNLTNFFRTLMHHDPRSLIKSDYIEDGGKLKLQPKPFPLPYYQGLAGLHRVIDMVAVPSLHVGTETWLSPTTFGSELSNIPGSSNPILKDPKDPRYGFQPPFNKLPSRREPGKVNINTIPPPVNHMSVDPNLLPKLRFASPIWNGIYHSLDRVNLDGLDDNDNDGIADDFSHAGAEFRSFIGSRRGYGPHFPEVLTTDPNFINYFSTSQPTYLNSEYPTIFANPFRHGDSGYLVPVDDMVLQGIDCTLARHAHPIKGNDGEWGVAGRDDGNEVDDGNLIDDNKNGLIDEPLEDSIDPVMNGLIDDPAEVGIDPYMNGLVDDLLEQDLGLASTNPRIRNDDSKVPLNGATTSANTDNNLATIEQPWNMFRDAPRNPYFRYSPISRLSSMTTTRSNVFAVWVTIGFFEVNELDESDPDDVLILRRFGPQKNGTLADATQDPLFHRVYPDGYTFGKEAGVDTGQTVRYREFAIIDRTIPVGFEPGADHNVTETVRLRRRIE